MSWICKSLLTALDAGVFISDMDPYTDIVPRMGWHGGVICTEDYTDRRHRLMGGTYARPHVLPLIDHVLSSLSDLGNFRVFDGVNKLLSRQEKMDWMAKAVAAGIHTLDCDEGSCDSRSNLIFVMGQAFGFVLQESVPAIVELAFARRRNQEHRDSAGYRENAMKVLLVADQASVVCEIGKLTEDELYNVVRAVNRDDNTWWWGYTVFGELMEYSKRKLSRTFLRQIMLRWFWNAPWPKTPFERDQVLENMDEQLSPYYACCDSLTRIDKDTAIIKGLMSMR